MAYEVMVPEFRYDVTERTRIEDQTVYSVSLNVMLKWAKRSGQSLEKRNKIAIEQIRVDRNRGKWLNANIPKEGGASGGRPTRNPTKNSYALPTLKDAGIGHYESPRLRAFAELTGDDIDAYISSAREITEAGLYNEYKRLYRKKPTDHLRIHGDFRDKASDIENNATDTVFMGPPHNEETVPLHGKSSLRTIEGADTVRITFSCEKHLWNEFSAYADDGRGNTTSSELRRLLRRYVEGHRKMEERFQVDLK